MDVEPGRCFVLKPDELPALNYLPRSHPRPASLIWINRGTSQELRPTTVEMLLRTLFRKVLSPSIARLHQTSGLRVIFQNAADRDKFVGLFQQAHAILLRKRRSELTAIFDNPADAETGYLELIKAGVDPRSISLLWRAGQFLQANHAHPPVLAGAILGMTLLTLPGIGPVVAGGAIAATALSTIGAVGGALGASAGGIARMLSDIDVDDHEVPFFVMQITTGKVFLSVDPKRCDVPIKQVSDILDKSRGHFAPRGNSQ